MLSTLVLTGAISTYMVGVAYLEYRKGGKDVESAVRDGGIPLAVMGLFMVIMGLYGEFVWPLNLPNGDYNIFFFDPYVILGLVLMIISTSILFKRKLVFGGVMAFFSGILAIYYGAIGYSYGLTSEPLAALGLYIAFGATGILTLPATYIYDYLPGRGKVSSIWMFFLVLFFIALVASTIIAGIIVAPAIQAHLLTAP